LFGRFENLVSPYPEGAPRSPPQSFAAFIWACSQGMRPILLGMTLCTAVIAMFEALLFSMLGHVVDWLTAVEPAQFWAKERGKLLFLAAVIAASPLVVALEAFLKHQALAANFPMRMRWNFHRLMLGQSMSFYQDEFAGRIAAKVMQTALAVRDTWMIIGEMGAFVVIYFATIVVVLGGFDLWMLLPFLGWLAFYLLTISWFVPRLGRVAMQQADARSLMTGRIADAYTNIATVKLFSHAKGEAGYARGAMREFMHTAYAQFRLVTGFEIVNHTLSMLLIAGSAGVALWLWMQEQVGVGAVAAATAMALRLNGISHWIMWEFASLFEHIGTVQDGIDTLARPHTVLDRPDAPPLKVPRGEIRFEHVSFGYGGRQAVIDDFSIHIRPGEKIGLVGRSGAGKSTIVSLLLRFYDVERGRVLIDEQNVAEVAQDSLRAQVGMVTQDTSLLHRSVRDNILYGRPDADDAQMMAAARRAEAHDFAGPDRSCRPAGVRRTRGRARRQALRRTAPAGRDRARHAEGRADPDPRRGDQRSRQRGRDRDPGKSVPPDGGKDRGGDRPPLVDHRGDGPSDRDGQGSHRGGGRSRDAAWTWRALRPPVGSPERRLPRRDGRGRTAARLCNRWRGACDARRVISG
jgi:ATP-binding cassette subfamily B multidrug efflux pump